MDLEQIIRKSSRGNDFVRNLRAVAQALKPKTVVEFGMHWGLSTRIWSEVAETVHTYDLDRRREISEENVVFHQGDCLTVFALDPIKCDVAFLDANHDSLSLQLSVVKAYAEKIVVFLPQARVRISNEHHTKWMLGNFTIVERRHEGTA